MDAKTKLGLIHFYYGSGKGKTSASIGVMVRALAYEMKIVYVQFLKNGRSSENFVLNNFPNIMIISVNDLDKFTFEMNEEELSSLKKAHNDNFIKAKDLCMNDECNILILDEIVDAIKYNLIDADMVYDFLLNKPEKLEVIMTGHDKNEKIIELSDYVSEIINKKHPYEKGIEARFGIDK